MPLGVRSDLLSPEDEGDPMQTCTRTLAARPTVRCDRTHERADEEVVYGEVAAHGWRWLPGDPSYDHRTLLLGGPVGWLVTGGISFARNRHARRAAERAAAPQWRPLGPVTVRVTDRRLLVWWQGEWGVVDYSTIVRMTVDCDRLTVTFADCPAFLLYGLGLADVIGLAGLPTGA